MKRIPLRIRDPKAWLALFVCVDCGVNTRRINEYYMVKNEIWRRAHQDGSSGFKGMLCIGCLESRLGRLLKAEDFTLAPVNSDKRQSARLYSRLHT